MFIWRTFPYWEIPSYLNCATIWSIKWCKVKYQVAQCASTCSHISILEDAKSGILSKVKQCLYEGHPHIGRCQVTQLLEVRFFLLRSKISMIFEMCKNIPKQSWINFPCFTNHCASPYVLIFLTNHCSALYLYQQLQPLRIPIYWKMPTLSQDEVEFKVNQS